MKYIAYVRKSTDDKVRQVQSIPNQLDWVKDAAQQLGVEIIATFRDKKTASEPGRDGFNEMMRLVQDHDEPIGIICWKMHRLARNPIDEGAIKYSFIKGKIRHIFASDRQFREGENQILMGVEFGAATQYTLDLKTSVDFGMKRKIESGYRPTYAPLGYLNDKHNPLGKRKIYKDPERFDTLKWAWKKILTGAYSVEQIRKILNANGFTTRKGRPLVKSYLYKMFSNTFYAGYYTWQGKVYQGKHIAMITPKEFEKVQTILGKKSATRPYRNNQLFSGIISCGECGFSITSEYHFKTIKKTQKKKCYTYLRCSKKSRLVKCTQKYISIEKASEQIEAILLRLKIPLYFLDFFCECHKNRRKAEKQERGRKLALLQQKYNDNEVMIQKLIDNLNREMIDDNHYQETMQRYTDNEEKLTEQIKKVKATNEGWIEDFKNDFCFATNAWKQYKNGEENIKREILTRIGSNWNLKDQKLAVELFPPFLLFTKFSFFAEGKNTWLELWLHSSKRQQKALLFNEFPGWLPLWEEVRTFYSGAK